MCPRLNNYRNYRRNRFGDTIRASDISIYPHLYYHELPEWRRQNPYIIYGYMNNHNHNRGWYKFAHNKAADQCIYLFGLILFIIKLICELYSPQDIYADADMIRIAVYINYVCAIVICVVNLVWYNFEARSEGVNSFLRAMCCVINLLVYYCGYVSAVMILFDTIFAEYVCIFISLVPIIICGLIIIYNIDNDRRNIGAYLFAALILSAIYILMLIYKHESSPTGAGSIAQMCNHISAPATYQWILPLLIASCAYIFCLPERFAPRIFDFCGNSENIWNFLLLMTLHAQDKYIRSISVN
jgi:hypothetical protein